MKDNYFISAEGEIISRLDAKGQEVPDPVPTAVLLGRTDRPRSLSETLARARREPILGDFEYDEGDFDDVDDPSVSHLPEHTPYQEGFSSSTVLTREQARKIALKHGLRLADDDSETSEPVVKTKPAKSAPIKQAPEPSADTSGSDDE